MGVALGQHLIVGGDFRHSTFGALAGIAIGVQQVWPTVVIPTLPPIITHTDGSPFITAVDVAKGYGLPDTLDGTGVKVGVIEFGAQPQTTVLQAYANLLGVTKTLNISNIRIDGLPPNPAGGTGEWMLDLCAMVPIIPGAEIRTYTSQAGTFQAFNDTIARALAECDLVSCSWGYGDEIGIPESLIMEMEDMLSEARGRGVSFFNSSGDFGADAGPYPNNTGRPNFGEGFIPAVGYPQDCPSNVTVGCTNLFLDGSGNRINEKACTFSGGGISKYFPDTQVPFVTCFGDPENGIPCPIDAGTLPITAWIDHSSTSGSAALMAAMHTLMVQHFGRPFSFMDFALKHPECFYDIVETNVEGDEMNPRIAAFIGANSTLGDGNSGLVAGALGTAPTGNWPGTGTPLITQMWPIGPTAYSDYDVSSWPNGSGVYPMKTGRDLVSGIGSPNGAAIMTALDSYVPVTGITASVSP
jgi:hypothetical protein